MIGLYIHIPFCTKKCHYCNFVITTQNSKGSHALFLESLEKEIIHHRQLAKKRIFETLYIGGGTPSVLSGDETIKLFELIRRYFRFKPKAEITMEVNPGDFDLEKAKLYKKLGINRISLGIQSFNDYTLNKINRTHYSASSYEAFKLLRNLNFDNINADLILALPKENLDDVEHSLDSLIAISPDHISVYELTIEEKTVFGRRHKKGMLKLPAEETQLKMLLLARQKLKNSGYEHYELLNYAKSGYQSRHNLLYWGNQEYLGLGPGAFSYVNGCRYQFADSVDGYFAKISRGEWANFEEESLSEKAKQVESFLLALRLTRGASVQTFKAVIKQFSEEISALKSKDLLKVTHDRIHLTPQGQLFAEQVFTELSLSH